MKNFKLGKGLLALLSILVLGLFLVACGDDNGGNDVADNNDATEAPAATEAPTEAPDEEPDPVELTIGWWGGEVRHDLTMEVIALFEERYPHISINPEFASWDDYWTMLNTAAVAGNLPDIIQMDMGRIREFTDNNLIIGLNDLIDSGLIDMSEIDMEAYQGLLNLNGQYMGISLGANGFAMAYNTELAAELDFEFTPELTWNEFADFLRETRAARDDFYGWMMGAEFEIMSMFARDHGYNLFEDDGLGAPREVFLAFFEMLDTFNRDEIILTIERADAMAEGENALHHEVAISQMIASNQVVGIQNEVEAQLGVALLPRIEGGVNGEWIRSSMQWSISAHSNEQEAAAKFINFFIHDLEANTILRAERGAPISDAVRAHLAPLVDPVVVQTFDILPLIARYQSRPGTLPPPQHIEVGGGFARAVEQIRFGTFTPEEAVDYFMDNAERIFDW